MSYWTDRMERADRRLDRSEASMDRRLKRFYERELKALEKEVAAFYARYGEDGVLRYRTMLQTMDQADFDLLMQDCDEFARQHPELADMVEIRKDIYKLDRMEGLQAYARLHLARAAAESADGLRDHFLDAAAESQRAVADAMGYDDSFHVYDEQAIAQFVGQRWSDGQSYSEKIWADTGKVAQYVQKDLVDALIRGDSYAKLAEQMRKRFGQSEYNVMRVIRTEGTYVARQAQGAAMREQGIDSYYIDAVGDERTCDECGHADRDSHDDPYPFEGAVVGENYPPLHPNCRCQVNPGVADWDEWLRKRRAERRAVSKKVSQTPDEPAFTPAKTKKAATEFLKSFGFKKVSGALTLDELNSIGEAFNRCFARYPFMKGFSSELNTGRTGTNTVAQNWTSMVGSVSKGIEFDNGYKFNRKAIGNMEQTCKYQCRKDADGVAWWTQKKGLAGLVMHEFAHAMDNKLTLKRMGIELGVRVDYGKWDEYKSAGFAREVCSEAFARLGIPYTKENIAKHISGYGSQRDVEALAEAVSCEDETNEVCNMVKTVLDEKIKEIEG